MGSFERVPFLKSEQEGQLSLARVKGAYLSFFPSFAAERFVELTETLDQSQSPIANGEGNILTHLAWGRWGNKPSAAT